MAGIRKRNGRWIADINKKGVRKSKSFATKAQAVAWATQFEADLADERIGLIPNKTFGELLTRYVEEVSPKKRGEYWEINRIKKYLEEPFSSIFLRKLRSSDFVEWREKRLKQVSPSTVNREMNLLSNCCTVAVKEWGWLKENPLSNVSRPKNPPPRDRLISEEEIEKILFSSGYDAEKMCETVSSRVGAAFIFAIETAMRAGEIVKLKWEDVDMEKRIARLWETKNGSKRDVPLSTEAIRIIKQMPKESDSVFNLSSANLDALFRKIRNRCMIEDLHFHDTRHEAITRLSKKLDVLPLARMVGHKDLKMLMVYYNETAEELAKKLD